MRLHRFFIGEKLGEQKELIVRDTQLFHQLKHVFRYNIGSQIILLDNSGFEYSAVILSFARGELEIKIIKKEKGFIPKREVCLFQSLIKKDNFEWILEKGTELGIYRFVPIISERSEKKSLNMSRGNKILKEASEQSGRGILPTLCEPLTIKEALDGIKNNAIVFDSSGIPFSTFNFTLSTFNLLIGPEGGWSEKELEMFKEKNIPVYSLGVQTLRAETASIVASSLFLLNL